MFNLSGTKKVRLTDGSLISYELIKKSRRTLSLKITPKGLEVHAPLLISKSRIDQLIQNKSHWIQKKLQLTLTYEKPFEVKNGESFKIFDKELMITVKLGKNNITIDNNICLISYKNLSDYPKLKNFF